MKHELCGLHSSNLAHILSSIGIAYFIRALGRVGWSEVDPFVIIESDTDPSVIDDAIEAGFREMRSIFRDFNRDTLDQFASMDKKQGRKGRKIEGNAALGTSTSPSALALSKLIPPLSPSARDALPSMFCLGNSETGNCRKTRAMFGKVRLWQAVADDEMRLQAMPRMRGVIEELSDPTLMSSSALQTVSAKTGTGYDTSEHTANIGMSQSLTEKHPHPMVEMLAIAGLRALPAVPGIAGNPRHRGMTSHNGHLQWSFPIWREPIGYYEIEDFIADGRKFDARKRDIQEVREFSIKKNGNVFAIHPYGVQRFAL